MILIPITHSHTQEVDRLSDHGPILSAAGYDFTHVIGGYEDEGKQHGLLIGWKRARFDSIAEKVIRLDEESVGPRAGLSRSTRNVALMCTLRSKQDPHSGLIIGTAHLFWHARFAYERARQAAFLSRAIQSFRADQSTITWPVFLAGDFNDQPGGPAYRFMTGLSLDDHQRQIFKQSSLVHRSVDDVAGQPREGEYATIEGDEDQVFKDVRSANVGDGLFEEAELRSICGPHRWVSLYGRWGDQMQGQEGNWFKDREEEIARRAKHGSKELSREHQLMRGDFEPMWSSSSHSWVRQALDDH